MTKKRKSGGIPLLPGLPGPPELPGPGEIKEVIEGVVEGLQEASDIPKTLMEHAVQADQDFRHTDKSLRSTKFRRKRS